MPMTISRFVLSLGFVASVVPVALTAEASPAQAPADRPRREPAPAAAPAEASRRVVVTAVFAPAYSCAAVTCRVVTELDKGTVVSLVKTDGDWYQVLVRTSANAMTTGWVKASQVASSAGTGSRSGEARTDGAFRPSADASLPADAEPDPRGCLTCVATREPTPEEWEAAIADAATKKAAPAAGRPEPGLADGRTSEERMRDLFAERYDPELKRLAGVAASVDAELQSYFSTCFQRFASIPVEGAAPRSSPVDEILKAARSSPGAARFSLWSGTAAFQWNPTWAPQATNDTSSATPSCERVWEDVRGRADRLKVDLELLERDALEHGVYPGIVREMLAARNLAESEQAAPTAPVTRVR
jgi:hypothetical protein